MKYRKEYLKTRDIDWFCNINNVWIHVASAGGNLPDIVNDSTKNRDIQFLVAQLPDIHNIEDINVNEKNLAQRFSQVENIEEARNNYLLTFVAMAKKGFVSFDRTNLSEQEDNHYHIVAWPKKIKPLNLLVPTFNIETFNLKDPAKLVKVDFIELCGKH